MCFGAPCPVLCKKMTTSAGLSYHEGSFQGICCLPLHDRRFSQPGHNAKFYHHKYQSILLLQKSQSLYFSWIIIIIIKIIQMTYLHYRAEIIYFNKSFNSRSFTNMQNFLWNQNPSIRRYSAVKVVNSKFFKTQFFFTTLSFVDQ